MSGDQSDWAGLHALLYLLLVKQHLWPPRELWEPCLLQADIAVLDEIDSGLDIDALRDVADAVNSLKRPNSATLMVTHYKVFCLPCT